MNVNNFKSKNLQTSKLRRGPARLTLLSMFCALTVSISYVESQCPLFPFLTPGAKPGFSNIVTMFVCSYFGIMPSIIIILIKSFFTAMTRGFIAFIMSFLGGILSTFLTGLLLRYSSLKYIYIGMIGAAVHNLSQIIVASYIIGNCIFYYIPILILFSIITGSLTGLILHIVLPVLSKMYDYF